MCVKGLEDTRKKESAQARAKGRGGKVGDRCVSVKTVFPEFCTSLRIHLYLYNCEC